MRRQNRERKVDGKFAVGCEPQRNTHTYAINITNMRIVKHNSIELHWTIKR